MNDFWSRAIAVESRHSSSLGGGLLSGLGRTLEESVAAEAERDRLDKVIAWCNKSLVAQGIILERHNPVSNPAWGRFVIREVSTKQVMLGDVDPDFVARRLTRTI